MTLIGSRVHIGESGEVFIDSPTPHGQLARAIEDVAPGLGLLELSTGEGADDVTYVNPAYVSLVQPLHIQEQPPE
jgi:hypothetical protein